MKTPKRKGHTVERLFATLALCLFTGYSFAAETVQFFVDNEDCGLKERGYAAITHPIIISGKPYEHGSLPSGCTVSIPRSEFEQQFQLCYLSGVSVTSPKGGSCDVSYYKQYDAYLFETRPNGGLLCRFSCVKR